MNNNKSVYRYSLIHGMVLGITLCIIELLAYFLGIIIKPIMYFINITIIVTMLIIAIKKYRDQLNNKIISFGIAFLIGFFTLVVSSVLFSIYRYTEFSLSPSLTQAYILELEERMLNSALPEDLIEVFSENSEEAYQPFNYAISTIFNIVFWGTILSLILAAIFKREGNPLLNDTNL